MKKYLTDYGNRITEVECVRETAQSVFIMESRWQLKGPDKMEERKHAKVSGYTRYHDSWEAAHAFLLARATENLESARRALERARGEHGNVVGMKKPETTAA